MKEGGREGGRERGREGEKEGVREGGRAYLVVVGIGDLVAEKDGRTCKFRVQSTPNGFLAAQIHRSARP